MDKYIFCKSYFRALFFLVEHVAELGVVDAASLVFVKLGKGGFCLFLGQVGADLLELVSADHPVTIGVNGLEGQFDAGIVTHILLVAHSAIEVAILFAEHVNNLRSEIRERREFFLVNK
jgi:hypothetical protein